MPVNDMPAAEIDIDVDLVRSLLEAQVPDLAGLPLVRVANGWDNVLFRLGDELCVRLPRRQMAAALVDTEQRWLSELAPRLPLAVPAPIHCGVPTGQYPWRWSVCPWFEGDHADASPPRDIDATADVLTEFLDALHQPAPDGAPVSPYRGGSLTDRDAATQERLEILAGEIDVVRVKALWEELRDVPGWDDERRWFHGDLHPGNVIVRDRAVTAVVDFGDMGGGDHAVDLIVAWTLFPTTTRRRFVGRYDANVQARGKGWALNWSLATLANSADNPLINRLSRRGLAAVLEDS